jgi:hypothetical protein
LVGLKLSIWKRALWTLSTQAKTNIITILLIKNTLPEVDTVTGSSKLEILSFAFSLNPQSEDRPPKNLCH